MAQKITSNIEPQFKYVDSIFNDIADNTKFHLAQIEALEVAMKESIGLSNLSYSEKMHLNKFSLSDIERLFMALSLFITAEDRPAYDAILTTWINDRYAEMGTRHGK